MWVLVNLALLKVVNGFLQILYFWLEFWDHQLTLTNFFVQQPLLCLVLLEYLILQIKILLILPERTRIKVWVSYLHCEALNLSKSNLLLRIYFSLSLRVSSHSVQIQIKASWLWLIWLLAENEVIFGDCCSTLTEIEFLIHSLSF